MRGRTRAGGGAPVTPSRGVLMNIFANTVVTMTFELFDSDGALLESTPEPITYLHGGHSGMLPKVEEALNLKKIGDAISIDVEPADAFGDYDPELVKIEPAESLPPEVEVGMQFEAFANKDDEPGSGIVFTVTDIAEGKVVLDGNHPWAGKRLRFDCRILDVRAATAEEVEHGHVHGDHGHHH
jgi:FKBP-type peptidyl-prolyl cis-trans isomerase SlyD